MKFDVDKILVHLPNGYRLVAAKTPEYDFPYEIFLGIEDAHGYWIQDLAIVRNKCHIEGEDIVPEPSKYTVFVFGDETNEDYTDRFDINQIKEEEN